MVTTLGVAINAIILVALLVISVSILRAIWSKR
jgi:hypothetical protein